MHELDAFLEKGAVRLLADTRTSLPANGEPHNQFVTFTDSGFASPRSDRFAF